jgi:hypothetical protein
LNRGTAEPRLPLSYLAALIVAPWITYFVRLRGRALLGGDTVPSLDPALTLSWTRELWGNHVLLGGGTSLMLGGAFPHLALLTALHGAGLAPADAAKFELAMCWSLAALGAYIFARACGLTGWPAALAVTPYACGPIAYMLYSTPTIAGVGAYATAPFAAAAVVEVARSVRNSFLLSIAAALLFGLTSQNPAFSAVPLIGAGFLSVGLAATDPEYRRRWFAALLPLATIVACNLWWMVPEYAAFYHDSAALLANQFNADYIRESVARQRRDNSLYYMLRLAPGELFRDGFYNGPFGMMLDVADVLAKYFAFFPISIFLLTPVALFSAWLVSHTRDRSWNALYAVIAVFFAATFVLCTGHAFPGLFLFFVIDRLPAHELFREPYTKFGILMSLALVPIAGWSLRKFGSIGWVRITFAAYCAVLLAPLLVGRGSAADYAGKPLLGVAVPAYVVAMRRHLIEQHATDLNTRILQLPMSANSSLEARTWGYFGPGFYRMILPGGTIESYGGGSADPASDSTIRRLVDLAQAGNSGGFAGLAAWVGITHVLWDGASVPTFGGRTAADVWHAFVALRGLKLEYAAGPLRLYRLASPSPLFSVSPELVLTDEPARSPEGSVAISRDDAKFSGLSASPDIVEATRIPPLKRSELGRQPQLAQRSIPLAHDSGLAAAVPRAACSAHTSHLVMTNAHLAVDVTSPCEAFLALRTAFSDGWVAESTAQGETTSRPLKHFRAFGFANAWALPPGQWHVSARFTFDDMVGRWRVLGALATLTVFLLWMPALAKEIA